MILNAPTELSSRIYKSQNTYVNFDTACHTLFNYVNSAMSK